MDQQTVDYYNEHGDEVAKRYEAADEGIETLFPFVFSSGERVLDVGSGSGRNLAALRRLGVEAFGLEPSEVLRKQAVKIHPQLIDRISAGSLPRDLSGLRHRKYDGILLSAVIMHIPDAELFDSVFAVRELLNDGGVLLLSFSTERGDTKPADKDEQRDTRGRLMVLRSAARVRLLFERLGFVLESEYHSADSMGRRDVSWTTMVFRYISKAAPRAVDRIESILNSDRKVATYKLALIRSLCDLALTEYNTVSWTTDGKVGIPLSAVAALWVRYYWPLFEPSWFIPQINGEAKGAKPVGFRAALNGLIEHYAKQGGLNAFMNDYLRDRLSPEAKRLYGAAIRKIGAVIVKGPVQYSGGAMGRREFAYDDRRAMILVDPDFWREVVLMAHWVQDAVILRWAEMTTHLAPAEDRLSMGAVLGKLLESANPLRADHEVRYIYEERLPLECVWSGRRLGSSFEVDHALPFALWQNSSWWNLFPAAPKVNNAKRDRLPSLDLIRRRKDAIVSSWELLHQAAPARFALDSSKLAGRQLDLSSPDADWQNPLFTSFVEAVEYTASSRGVPRWEP